LQEGYYSQEDKLSVILFETENEQFAINIYDTKEIILAGQIRKLPQSYDFVDGIYNYRGEIIHIVNLSKKLNLNEYKIYNINKDEEKYSSDKKYIIIVSVNNVNVGFLVDRILDIANIDSELIEGLSPIFQTSVGIEYIKGIIKFKDRPRILLDLSKILTEVEQTIMDKEQTITK
jgi:purine-binding chemotaxis protein CheW